MIDRSWIIATLLDLRATDGEVVAAAKVATPSELRAVEAELGMERWWVGLRMHDIEGKLAHLSEQNPALD